MKRVERRGGDAAAPVDDPAHDEVRREVARVAERLRRRARGAATAASSAPRISPRTMLSMHSSVPDARPLLSILVPVYNEERTVLELLRRVCAVELPIEVIVVDDGSTDATPRLLDGVEGVTVLHHERNRGKGAAVATALARARGEACLIQDADLEYEAAGPAEASPGDSAGLGSCSESISQTLCALVNGKTMAAVIPSMSAAPRPQTMPSTSSPSKGSRSQPAGSTGTTSVWPMIRRVGAPRSRPSSRATTLPRPGVRLEAPHRQAGPVEERCQRAGVARLATRISGAVVHAALCG